MKFQLERILLFSDAVFAIAITLMIIEIKPPHLEHNISFERAFILLLQKAPIFIGIILSFFLIGLFWIRHHDLMKYMISYDSKFLWLNFAMLLSIAFIPFSTSFVFENSLSFSPLPFLVYNLNFIASSLITYKLYSYALNPTNKLCIEQTEKDLAMEKKEILFPILVYIFVIILAFIHPYFAPMGYAAFALKGLMIKKKRSAQMQIVKNTNE